jgi:hypothetical protein
MSEQDYTATAVEEEEEREHQAAPPPRHYAPQNQAPQGYPPQGYRNGPVPGAPPPQVGHGVPRGFVPSDHRGPRPLDLVTRTDERFLRIKRVKVSKGADEDEVGTGYCGNVADLVGFEDEIAKQWGGGLYEVSGIYEGKQRVESVKIAGASLPIRPEPEDEEEATEYSYPSSYTEAGRGGSRFGQRSLSSGAYGSGYQGGYQGGYGYPDPYDPYDPYSQQGYGGYGGHGGYPPAPQQPYPSPYAQQHPYAQQSYPGYGQQGYPAAYGQQAYGYAPPMAPAAGVPGMPGYQAIPGQPSNVYQPVDKEKDAELEAIRARLAEAEAREREAADLAAQEREDRRLEAQAAEAREREAELKREMDRMKAESDRKLDLLQQQADKQAELMQRSIDDAARRSEEQNRQFMAQLAAQNADKGSSSFDKMMEMQMMQLQAQQARGEQERLEAQARWRQEQEIRRAEAEKKSEEYRRERERQDQMRGEEREREERRRSDSEKHYQHLMELSQKGQQTPDQMLGMLKTMVDMQPKQENATEKVMELANAALAMREVLGGNQEQESKWERIIKTGGEALSGAIGRIQAGKQAEAQAAQGHLVAPHQPLPQQHPALPGPTPQQVAYQQHMRQRAAMAAQAQAQTQARAPAPGARRARDPEPEDWGKILKFVVDCHDGENDPEETATHVHAMVDSGMELPKAIEALEKATVPELKFQLSMISISPQIVATGFKPKVDRLSAILDTEDGEAWIEEFLDAIRQISQAIRAARAEQTMAAQAASAQVPMPQPQPQPHGQQLTPEQAAYINQQMGHGTPEQQAYARQQFEQQQAFMARRRAQAQQGPPAPPVQGVAQFQSPHPPQPIQPQRELTPEEFRARADGVDLSAQAEDFSAPPEGGSSADFAKQARGEPPPPPRNEWDEPA